MLKFDQKVCSFHEKVYHKSKQFKDSTIVLLMFNHRQNSNNSKWKSVKMSDNSENLHKRIVWTNSDTHNKKIPNTMNLSIVMSSFCANNISFLDTKINKIIEGTFSSIIYSDVDSIFNGIYFKIAVKDLMPYMKKGYCNVDTKRDAMEAENNKIVEELVKVENDIINYYQSYFRCNKQITKIIQNIFNNGCIKISNEMDQNRNEKINKNYYILKISGVWETDSNIGITLKFLE